MDPGLMLSKITDAENYREMECYFQTSVEIWLGTCENMFLSHLEQ